MAKRTKHYDERGNETGTTWDKGDHQEHYDTEGNFTGSSYDKGKYTQHYDEQGRKNGRTWDRENHTEKVDNSNDYTGSTWDKGNHQDHYNQRGEKTGESWEKKSGCFITSACVEAKGLPDDSLELSTLRNFRDTYVRQLPQGVEQIQEYYATAPLIVQQIRKLEQPLAEFNDLFTRLVQPAVQYIQIGKMEEALLLYQDIFTELRNKYLGGLK